MCAHMMPAGLLGFPPKELQYRFLAGFTPVFYIRQRDYSKVCCGLRWPATMRFASQLLLSARHDPSIRCKPSQFGCAVGVRGAVHHQLQRGTVPRVPRPLAGAKSVEVGAFSHCCALCNSPSSRTGTCLLLQVMLRQQDGTGTYVCVSEDRQRFNLGNVRQLV